MKIITNSPILDSTTRGDFYKEMAEGEGMGEYDTAGGGSWEGTQYGVDGPDSSDAQFKQEMAEGEGEGEYWTSGGGSYLGMDGAESDAQFKKEMAEGEGENEYYTAGGGSWSEAAAGSDGVSDGGQVRDNFKSKEFSAGGMTVRTENPVYEDTQIQADEWMSSVSGATRRARRRSKKKSGGTFWDKVKGAAGKVADSGIIQNLMAGQQGQQGGFDNGMGMDPSLMNPQPLPPANTDTGMKTGTKIAIGVGVAALIGTGVYLYMKSQKGKGGSKKK